MKTRHRKPVTVEDHKLAARCQQGCILVIDDDPEILSALSSLFTLEGYFCLTYTNALDFLKSLNDSETQILPFPGSCCVLCDVKMPDINGLEVQQQLATFHHMALLLMSGESAAPEVVHAFRAGVVDFLIKPLDAEVLLTSIEKALAVSTQKQSLHQQSSQLTSKFDQLTPREREVMLHVVAGKTNQAIATDLSLALRTVKLHRQRAMEKMEANSVADLVRFSVMLSDMDNDNST